MTSQETYEAQLIRIAQALAAGKPMEILGDVAGNTKADTVKMFTDGNLDKRFDKLQRQLEFAFDAFEDTEDLLIKFIKEQPLASYDTGASDGECMLKWMEQTMDLSPEQCDHIACQRARHALEDVARKMRVPHIHFQEILGMAETVGDDLEGNPNLRVHLNPIRVWSRFETPVLLDEDAEVPADVLFFPVGSDIRTAVLEDSGRLRVEVLEQLGACSFERWAEELDDREGMEVDREELIAFAKDLAEMGLLAFG